MNVRIGNFLTGEQIREAIALYTAHAGRGFAQMCADKIIEPNIEAINRKLGQENDPKYLAYAVEYVMMQTIKLPPTGGR